MSFSMTGGRPTCDNASYVHSWLQDTVEAHKLLLDNIACFLTSDFGGAHSAFCTVITCAVRRYGFLLIAPPDIYRPYLATHI
jgi:L-fucose mutarotase/ribose pyranase (RbsD/FucU family)